MFPSEGYGTSAVVFDVDGTLIDVGGSYKQAIIETVAHYLPLEDRDVIRDRMMALKSLPNFNNDWDASYYIIQELSGREPCVRRDAFWNDMRDIFQSYYLGYGLYRDAYGKNPPIHLEKGLISTESPLISEETLKYLGERYLLGVATSRPRFEALYTLSRQFFPKYLKNDHIVTLDDVKEEKPDPEPLLLCKELLGATSCIYVGDTKDDVRAADAAGFKSIIVGKRWGDMYVPTINDLVDIL